MPTRLRVDLVREQKGREGEQPLGWRFEASSRRLEADYASLVEPDSLHECKEGTGNFSEHLERLVPQLPGCACCP